MSAGRPHRVSLLNTPNLAEGGTPRAFGGVTAFEEICRDWVRAQARLGRLPFVPEVVGSLWSKDAQVDVVAINWRERTIFQGESKLGADPVGRSVLEELCAKGPLVVPGRGEGWRVSYGLFARARFSEATREEARVRGVMLMTAEQIEQDLLAATAPTAAVRPGRAPRRGSRGKPRLLPAAGYQHLQRTLVSPFLLAIRFCAAPAGDACQLIARARIRPL